jgi:hypothetical protein
LGNGEDSSLGVTGSEMVELSEFEVETPFVFVTNGASLSLVLNFKSNGIGTGLRSSKIKKLINNHY